MNGSIGITENDFNSPAVKIKSPKIQIKESMSLTDYHPKKFPGKMYTNASISSIQSDQIENQNLGSSTF